MPFLVDSPGSSSEGPEFQVCLENLPHYPGLCRIDLQNPLVFGIDIISENLPAVPESLLSSPLHFFLSAMGCLFPFQLCHRQSELKTEASHRRRCVPVLVQGYKVHIVLLE